MTKYLIEYVGLIEINADSEEDAYKKFQNLNNNEIGKYVHSAELLNPQEYEDLYKKESLN